MKNYDVWFNLAHPANLRPASEEDFELYDDMEGLK